MVGHKKPSEENDFEDFFSRFNYQNYTDLTKEFIEK